MKLGTLLLRNAAISLTQLEAGLRAQFVGQAEPEREIGTVAIEPAYAPAVANAPFAIQEELIVEGQVQGAGPAEASVERQVREQRITESRAEVLSGNPALLEAKPVSELQPITDAS